MGRFFDTRVAPITITIHSSKPAISFTLTVHPTDTISAIKEKFAENESHAPPANVQRLVLKGKVLADNKLLQEYDDIKEGVVLNLMVKPGTTWNAEERDPSLKLRDDPPPQLHAPKPIRLSHGRSLSGAADQFPVPALTLSEPPSPTHAASPTGLKLGIPLDLIDMSIPPRPPSPRPMSATEGFSEIISSVPFWRHLKEFLDKEFNGEVRDADAAFEMFFLASKASLTPHEIARIRDVVGVTGMAGT